MINLVLFIWNVRGILAEDRLNDCKSIIKEAYVDLFYLIKTKIRKDVNYDFYLVCKLKLLSNEGSTNSFEYNSSGKILVK